MKVFISRETRQWAGRDSWGSEVSALSLCSSSLSSSLSALMFPFSLLTDSGRVPLLLQHSGRCGLYAHINNLLTQWHQGIDSDFDGWCSSYKRCGGLHACVCLCVYIKMGVSRKQIGTSKMGQTGGKRWKKEVNKSDGEGGYKILQLRGEHNFSVLNKRFHGVGQCLAETAESH